MAYTPPMKVLLENSVYFKTDHEDDRGFVYMIERPIIHLPEYLYLDEDKGDMIAAGRIILARKINRASSFKPEEIIVFGIDGERVENFQW